MGVLADPLGYNIQKQTPHASLEGSSMLEATALSPGKPVFHPRLNKTGTIRTKRGEPGKVAICRQGTCVYVDVDGKVCEWRLTSIGLPAETPPATDPTKVTVHGMGFDLEGISAPVEGPGPDPASVVEGEEA
jgi:hypothetical protein